MATVAVNDYSDSQSVALNAYLAQCCDASMEPRFRCGEFVIAEPTQAVAAGDEVMVETVDGRVIVRQLLSREDGQVQLGSVNKIHPILVLDEREIHAMHYVSGVFVGTRARPIVQAVLMAELEKSALESRTSTSG